jgi:hypothetical protein
MFLDEIVENIKEHSDASYKVVFWGKKQLAFNNIF